MVVYEHLDESINYRADGYDNSYSRSYMHDNWAQFAESTLPLRVSSEKFGANSMGGASFQASVEQRSRQISSKILTVNLISMLVNLALALIAFYFSFTQDSTSTTAFAADCVLDFISGGIVLWRYYGDLNSLYMQAREQIACIYLGALFELSALGIIAKAISDMIPGADIDATLVKSSGSHELFYLAIVATVACTIMTVYKCALYKILCDNSILLDVINTLISTIFAMSIVMSRALIDINPAFWYLDPVLSIILAIFMMGFGLKVIYQNFDVLRPSVSRAGSPFCAPSNNGYSPDKSSHFMLHPYVDGNGQTAMLPMNGAKDKSSTKNYGTNLNSLSDHNRNQQTTWQKSDYSTISFE